MNNPLGRRAFHTSVRMARCRSAQCATFAVDHSVMVAGSLRNMPSVEVFFEYAECRGFVAGDYAIGRSPFDNVFGEDMRPVGYDFVADD